MANYLWLLVAMSYSSAGLIEAQLTQEPLTTQQSSMTSRPLTQSSPGPQQFLSQQPTSMTGAMQQLPTAGMGQDPKTPVSSQPNPYQDPSSTQMPYSPNTRPTNAPPTISSPQMTTPAQMMTPPQKKTSAMDLTAPSQKNKLSTDPPLTSTPPASTNAMKQVPNPNSVQLSQVASLSAMNPLTPDQTNGLSTNATMADGKPALNKKKENPLSAKNQTSEATKNQTLLEIENSAMPVATNLPLSSTINRTMQAIANQTIPAKTNRKTALIDQPPPPQQTNSSTEMAQTPMPVMAQTGMPVMAQTGMPVMAQTALPAMAQAPISTNPMMSGSSIPSSPKMETINSTLSSSPESMEQSPPDSAQLIAAEKFNSAIQTNLQDEQKAQDLINQLKSSSKMKLTTHQLTNQAIFLNSLTPEQKMILESMMKSLSLTPTQMELERNYLGAFVSESDKMAHQAGFEAIKKSLTPEAQRMFDRSEGMKSLQLTDEQKYLYQEGSREYLEDPGARNQSGSDYHPIKLSYQNQLVLISLFFSGLLMLNL